ncbi:MAG TPA: hypothetical protein VLL52_08265 [Anaerolineae bacterium]|nr:hypothetical protein [Anaerolineae bacterium]
MVDEKEINRMVEGKKEGMWIEYYANGHKRREGAFKLGKKEGKWILYHKNGVVQSEATFHEGLYTGYYCSYYENGKRFREGHYAEITGKSSDGRKEGVWYQYLPDGETVQWQISYKRGRIVERIEGGQGDQSG